MKLYSFSNQCNFGTNKNDGKIHVFYQFFIPSNKFREHEINFCLQHHVSNEYIDEIHLLNEKLYNERELSISSPKIKQTNIGQRLTFENVFFYIRKNNLQGYFILLNADIILQPKSLQSLFYTSLHEKRQMMALLRYEYNHKNPNKSQLFGPRYDSQDTWIFHSDTLFEQRYDFGFNFPFGQPGCDNKIIYLMRVLGYEVINDPLSFVTYHVHASNLRSYTIRDTLHQPWGISIPPNIDPNKLVKSLGMNFGQIYNHSRGFSCIQFEDNILLRNYICEKTSLNQPFLIPRISGIENNVAVYCALINTKGYIYELVNGIKRLLPAMKNNAGILLRNESNIKHYSKRYLQAFEYCDLFGAWEIQGIYIRHIWKSHLFMMQKYAMKQPFWALAFDIFHYIFSDPWTLALKGKRILLVSPFEESLKAQVPIREKIYGIDLFPECEFVYLKPPQTHASNLSRDFQYELRTFEENIDEIWNDFDVALLSCGGYANPIGSYIYEKGKSAIYVGGVLQMYFGILGSRWEKERPDILKLFKNEHWTRPKASEKPKQCAKIEGGCYW